MSDSEKTFGDNFQGIFRRTADKITCGCYNCMSKIKDEWNIPLTSYTFIVCPDCGNKRCPKATDHNLACTNSNELDQPGSRY